MHKTVRSRAVCKELLYSIPGFAYFLYILFPLRFWEPFVFSNQTEPTVITVFFACILLLFTLPKMYQTLIFQFTKIDLIVVIYGFYLLFRLRYPLEKEYFFLIFAIACIYLYFRCFPNNYLKGLLFLIPLAGIAQTIDGVNRFTMPWQNLSHIMGIFNNTGLFGGFTALGLIVCAGLFFFSDSGKRYLKMDYLATLATTKHAVLFILCIILIMQIYASGSRASWLALFCAIIFLLHKHPLWKKHLNHNPVIAGLTRNPRIINHWLRYILFLCLFIFFIFSTKYLYGLKKDSADGRLLIAMVSIEMVKEAPVFGNGIPGFRAEYLNHQAGYFQAHPDSPWMDLADDVETPFDEFLKILIEQGIIGLLLFSFLLFFLFKKINQGNTHHYYILQSAILFILIFGLFSYPFDKLPFLVLFVFALAAISNSQNTVYIIRLRKASYLRIPVLLLLFLLSLNIALNAYCYSKSCRIWNHALAHFAGDREQSLAILKNLNTELNRNPVFLTTYGKALALGGHHREAAIVLEKAVKRQPLSFSYIELGKSYEATGFPDKALSCWKHAGWMVPARFTPLYLTMKLYFKNGEYDRAKEYAGLLLAKKIKIDKPEIDEMKPEAQNILNFQPP